MNRMIKRVAIAAGSLGLLGGAVAAAAPSAGAAPIGNGAYGAAAGGNIFLYPVANATVGNSPQVASNANISGLLSTGNILDRAWPAGASSIISQPIVVTLPDGGRLQATGIRSWCRIVDGTTVFGGVQIFGGSITYLGQSRFTIPLPTRPAADTMITLPSNPGNPYNPGTSGTVELNEQHTGSEHGFAAIHVRLNGQSVVLGVTGCYVNNP